MKDGRSLTLAAAAATLMLVAASCGGTEPLLGDTCSDPASGVIVTFVWDSHADTMRVHVCNAAAIAAAESYIETQTGAHIPSGPIVRGAGVDARVPFHFIPDSLELVEVAIELCDGRMMRTAAAVEEYFLGATGSASARRAPFCPWGARPISVE